MKISSRLSLEDVVEILNGVYVILMDVTIHDEHDCAARGCLDNALSDVAHAQKWISEVLKHSEVD